MDPAAFRDGPHPRPAATPALAPDGAGAPGLAPLAFAPLAFAPLAFALLACPLLACAPAQLGDAPAPGSAFDGWAGPAPSCPIDPDCHIGGDCGLYDCPDHWSCQEVSETLERCINPGPSYPDEGDWECEDVDGHTVCHRRGSFPDGGGDGAWDCEMRGEFVVCTSDSPSYPDGGSSGPWTCRYEGEFRVCERRRDHPDDGGGACYGATCAPPLCEDWSSAGATFTDDRDDDAGDGQIWALGDGRRDRSCASVAVATTGWYSVFDTDIAESCSDQLDETGFLSIHNRCNRDGLPREGNVGGRYVVRDVDNGGACASDAECGAGSVCRAGNSHGRCCVPADPVYMGTFLLVAGESNEVCINHFCPLYRGGGVGGDALVTAECRGSVNSIHFQLEGAAFVCAADLEVPSSCR